MQRIAKFAMLGAIVFGLSSCAYNEKGPYQKVAVVTTPPAALCKIYTEQEGFIKSIATPGSKYIPRDSDPIQIVCEKDGYKTKSVSIKPEGFEDSVLSIVGSTVLTGGIGSMSDSYYNWPDRVEITLESN